jgi:hypothetical protein
MNQMRLDDLLARLADIDEDAKIFVAPPYEATSIAIVGGSDSGLELVCDVRTAKALLAPYSADPMPMRVARFRARAERVELDRRSLESAARTFSFEGNEVGCFQEHAPTSDGTYHFMPFRGRGHLRLVEALELGQRPTCSMPGCSFMVAGMPAHRTIDITAWSRS